MKRKGTKGKRCLEIGGLWGLIAGMDTPIPFRPIVVFVGLLMAVSACAFGQSTGAVSPASPASPTGPLGRVALPGASATPNAERIKNRRLAAIDRSKMLAELGIPDPLGLSVASPMQTPGGTTNYDEAKANPYPLTHPLQFKNGKPVRSAAAWWAVRRPEILKEFTTEIYGKIPENTPRVTWEVTRRDPHGANGTAMVKTIVGHIDHSGYPAASAHIDLTLYLPPNSMGPVPVIVQVVPGVPAVSGTTPLPFALPLVLAKGWGLATASTYTVQADTGAGLDNGVIGIVSRGQERKPDQWGALAAWSWGLSRVIDYLETDKAVDAKRLGVEGHSRWGKTALLAAALEPRWSIVYASCSGQCGAKPSRRNWGETLDNICGIGEYHWMAGNYLKYAKHWDKLPVDSPELISLVAPRPVFIGCGSTDRWADPHGQFLAVVAAGPVWKLLGKQDVGADTQPAPDVALTGGDIGYRMHNGGHTDELDFPTFLEFAGKYWGAGK